MEILNYRWFNGTIGFVKARDPTTQEIKYYIGKGLGLSEQLDLQHILAWGTKVTKEEVLEFFREDETI